MFSFFTDIEFLNAAKNDQNNDETLEENDCLVIPLLTKRNHSTMRPEFKLQKPCQSGKIKHRFGIHSRKLT